jgi:hypothetical protein
MLHESDNSNLMLKFSQRKRLLMRNYSGWRAGQCDQKTELKGHERSHNACTKAWQADSWAHQNMLLEGRWIYIEKHWEKQVE